MSILRRDLVSVVVPLAPFERVDSAILLADNLTETDSLFLGKNAIPLDQDIYKLLSCVNVIDKSVSARLSSEFEDNLYHLAPPEATGPLIHSLLGRHEGEVSATCGFLFMFLDQSRHTHTVLARL